MPKCCSSCKKTKPKTDFYKNRATKDGYTYQCKICKKISNKKWKKANPEKVRESKRRYRETHREELRINNRRYREKNPDYHKKWLRKKKLQKDKEYLKNIQRSNLLKESQCLLCGKQKDLKKYVYPHLNPTEYIVLCGYCNRKVLEKEAKRQKQILEMGILSQYY